MEHALTTSDPPLYGLLAQFPDADALIEATRRTHQAGYTATDSFSPYPIEELAHAMGLGHPIEVSAVFLAGAIIGGVGGYFMMWYAAAIDFPWVIGGRPLNPWPMFIPITFEMTVLFAGIIGLIGLLIFNKLPMPYHPLFKIPQFDRASQDAFFLVIESRDAQFDLDKTREFLHGLHPMEVIDVAP